MTLKALLVKLLHRVSRQWLPSSMQLTGLYHAYRLDNPEAEWVHLEQWVPRRRTAIDVGANVGCWTYKLAGLFEQVVSVELNEDCYRYIEAARLPNIQLLRHGLSDRKRDVLFYLPVHENGFVNHGWGTVEKGRNEALFGHVQERIYPVKPLDAYTLTNVDFIKIDVEGHELAVVEGALETIRRHRPILLIEASPATLKPLCDRLSPLGYQQVALADLTGERGSEGNYIFINPL